MRTTVFLRTLGEAAKIGGMHHATLLALLNRCLLDGAGLVEGSRRPVMVAISDMGAFREECAHWGRP